MKSIRSTRRVTLAMVCLLSAASQAHAITGAICIKKTLNGPLKLRATGACASTEIQIGSFDGTTLQFSGTNVQIVSGSGSTNGAVNGRGNLILGYDEPGFCEVSGNPLVPCHSDADCAGYQLHTCFMEGPKTGSHNFIVGAAHGYSSYGGLVAGEGNNITGPYATVTGGWSNTAAGVLASVSGGTSLSQPANYGWAAGSAESGNVFVGDFESP
jgi:hypothetical protein